MLIGLSGYSALASGTDRKPVAAKEIASAKKQPTPFFFMFLLLGFKK
jgi:hypothetical protein